MLQGVGDSFYWLDIRDSAPWLGDRVDGRKDRRVKCREAVGWSPFLKMVVSYSPSRLHTLLPRDPGKYEVNAETEVWTAECR